jgi:hypothetical protein
MEKEFKVGDIPYKIVGEDIYRLPFERNHKCFNLKKLCPNWQLRYQLNGQVYSMKQIKELFLKEK